MNDDYLHGENPPPINLFSDQPIESVFDDLLSRRTFAFRIADILIRRSDSSSLVIGLNAPWGEGKSSVLNMVTNQLNDADVMTLTFNPWRFSDEETLLRNFFFDLAKKLGVEIEYKKEKWSSIARKYSAVAAISRLIGLQADEVVKGFASLIQDAAVEELKHRIGKKLLEKKLRIVILMDDIDRLDVEEIHAVFRLVKLTGKLPYTAYILAFDCDRVAQAIATNYGEPIEAGYNFLEKIVQVSLPLPPASPKALLKITQDGINAAIELAQIKLEKENESSLSEHFEKAFRWKITTPRLSKRFTNSLQISLPLFKDEVNVSDAIFLEAIKVFYPNLYAALRDHGEIILESALGAEQSGHSDVPLKEVVRSILAESIADVSKHQRSGIFSLICHLVPGIFQPEFSRESGVDITYQSKLKSKRFCTREYYWQYFSYGISQEEISEKSIDQFLNSLGSKGVDVVAAIDDLVANDDTRFESLVNKLRLREKELDAIRSQNLAIGFSSISDRLPEVHSDDRAFSFGVRFQVARLICHLTESLKYAERLRVLKKILTETPSLMFAFDLAETLEAFGEKIQSNDDTWTIRFNGIEREVNKIVASRISEKAKECSLEEFDFLSSQALYLFWFFHDATSLSNHILSLISQSPEAVQNMISGLVRVNLRSDVKYSFYLNRQFPWFDVLRSLVDPKLIYTTLKSLHPELDTESESPDPAEKIAIEFARAYREYSQPT
ncbi:MAG: hypothetical protein KIS76_15860 [Pyrinomonadaceae bacterium]|nr:hypothetical protein [Pyrinomonadaceae bacterium]